MQKISAVIITFNEEMFIERCLQSLKDIADEIIVVDSFSTDATEDICNKFSVRFVKKSFIGFRDQKNYAISLATNQYILSVDADEALSEKLRESIINLKQNITADGYRFNRLANFCGQWIRHSGWYPDRQLRLFDKRKGSWGQFNVHERVELVHGSKIKRIKGDLFHWPCSSQKDYHDKIVKYADIAAFEFHIAGKTANIITPYIHGIWRFFLNFILRQGFLDGRNGYFICSTDAYYSFLKYKKLRNINQNGASNYNTYNGL
jgi:glycosyltransferase involved in cell wall biosynthesis